MKTRSGCKLLVTASCVSAICGLAVAADLDTSGQAGQYETLRAPVRVKGATGDFAPSRVWVPFILLNVQVVATNPPQAPLADPRQAFFDAAVIEEINGNPVGAVTTFAGTPTNPNPDRILAVLGTTDLAGGGFSNNVMIKEDFAKSNALGAILPDGTLVYRESFSSGVGFGQNNLGLITGVTGILPQTGSPEPIQQGHIFLTTAVEIGNATETAINPAIVGSVEGQARNGNPSAVRDPNVVANGGPADLLTGQAHFNALPVLTDNPPVGPGPEDADPASVDGVVVYRGTGNDPKGGGEGCFTTGALGIPGPDHIAAWMQCDVPFPLNNASESIINARQTQPVLAVVDLPAGGRAVYVVHGVGFSDPTVACNPPAMPPNIGGGSARPIYLAIDTITNPGGTPRLNYVGGSATLANNTILIEGDAVGGEGTQHGRPYHGNSAIPPPFGPPPPPQPPTPAAYANINDSSRDMRFVDHQATGGAESFANSQFDMNSSGQIAALWENRGVTPQRYEVRIYDPIWNGAGTRIEGYTLGKIVTFSGDPGVVVAQLVTTINDSCVGDGPANLEITLDPISGVAISDDGRVAFTAAVEKTETLGNWDNDGATAQTRLLRATTNALYVYEPMTDSIHEVLRGGQAGDTLVDAFPGSGPPANESLDLGFFPLDANSDSFNRDGFSRSGEFLTVVFRNSSNVFIGGVNTEFGFLPRKDNLVVNATPDNFTNRGGILYAPGAKGTNERGVRGVAIVGLGAFTAIPPCCLGNASKVPGATVNFSQILIVLANFGSPANPNGTSVGDANCDGFINFLDVLVVLAEFGEVCP